MKLIVWLGYGALLLLGVVVWVARQPESFPAMRAATTLPAQHRLETGDIELPGGPWYLRKPIGAGGEITRRDVETLPAVATAPGSLAVAARASRGRFRTGSSAWACGLPGRAPPPAVKTPVPTPAVATPERPLRVAALVCPESGDNACLALVTVPVGHAAAIAARGPLELRARPCS